MSRPLVSRRVPSSRRHKPFDRARRGERPPLRTSDLILAILGVALLGGLALRAALALAGGA